MILWVEKMLLNELYMSFLVIMRSIEWIFCFNKLKKMVFYCKNMFYFENYLK